MTELIAIHIYKWRHWKLSCHVQALPSGITAMVNLMFFFFFENMVNLMLKHTCLVACSCSMAKQHIANWLPANASHHCTGLLPHASKGKWEEILHARSQAGERILASPGSWLTRCSREPIRCTTHLTNKIKRTAIYMICVLVEIWPSINPNIFTRSRLERDEALWRPFSTKRCTLVA